LLLYEKFSPTDLPFGKVCPIAGQQKTPIFDFFSLPVHQDSSHINKACINLLMIIKMKMKRALFFFIVVMLISETLLAQNKVILDASKGKDTINKNIYGHFAEHLGHCIYGGFYVGDDNKKIPNKNGIRLDVAEALKRLKIPVLRWPGGCFADTYHWKDGIGPKKDRPSMLNIWWGNVKEDNSFGTNEFLNMCEMLGAEPYLSGNVGSGTPQELADWVKYTTHPNGSSPMPDLRARNGRPGPWKVKFWGLGNEAWGCGGNMTAEYYANVYRQYATFMTDWVNSDGLYRIASGASDDDYHWTEVLMKELPSSMFNALGLHHYSVIDWNKKGSSTDFSETEYFTTMQRALLMEELVSKHSAIMDKYDPQKRKALAVDEWGGWYDVVQGTNGAFLFQQNTMRDAMIAGATLNIFNNHCDRVKMANLAQIINVLQAVILTSEEKMVLTPTYHVMEMYNVHHDAVMLPVTVASNKYIHGKDMLDAVSVSSSRDKNGAVHISITNIDAHEEQEVKIDLQGLSGKSVTGRILRSDKLQDHNTFDNPQKIKPAVFNNATLNGNSLSVKMPPFSVVVLELK
jgi:alpha-L-arabinofuranosidase